MPCRRYLPDDSAAALRMSQLRDLYLARMAALRFSAARQLQLSQRMFFANVSVLSDTASFIQGVLTQWVSPANVIVATSDAAASGALSACFHDRSR
jgi:hypothetical protein